MTSSSVPWDARYQYLAGGVNTTGNWKTWQWDQLPPGQFALDYMTQSDSNGYLPVFTWYQMLQSNPSSGSDEAEKDYNNLNNPSTMNSYFSDFKLLLDKAKAFGKTVIIHVEPDLWGYLERRSPNPNNSTASVAGSGYGDVVANYPNTASGFARALVALRDKYAPNALLGFHISPWATQTYGNLGTDPSSTFNVAGTAQDIANFYNQTQANFDLLFYDIADRDAGYYQLKYGDSRGWWDSNNITYPNFNRFHQFVSYMTGYTGKRGVLWQVPLGNTLYRTMNNTDYHYQDNKAQYYLNSSNQHIQDAVDSGLIGIMFGSGGNEATINTDHGDGITNPAPINGNNLVSNYSDDDGGYIRVQAGAYYSRGPVYFGNPKFDSTPSSGSTLSLSTQAGTSVSTTFTIRNSGIGGPALAVSAPTLSGPNAGIFTVSPGTGFNIAKGATPVTLTVQCNPATFGTFRATLGFTTNDPAQSQVSFQLLCYGLAPHFSSAPYAPGSTITLSGQVGQPISLTLQIGNSGSPGTNLAVNAATLNQGVPGIFAVTPTAAFNLNQGAAPRIVTISCTPPVTGVNYTGTLNFPVTNDPEITNATFNLVCKGLAPLIVTAANEGDPGLTFSTALSTYISGQNIIVFNVTGNQVNISGSTALLANRGPVVIDGGGCSNGQPALTINGSGANLSLGTGVDLRNIRIKGIKLLNSGGGNKLGNCVVINKS